MLATFFFRKGHKDACNVQPTGNFCFEKKEIRPGATIANLQGGVHHNYSSVVLRPLKSGSQFFEVHCEVVQTSMDIKMLSKPLTESSLRSFAEMLLTSL
jgi:hypothetical protein